MMKNNRDAGMPRHILEEYKKVILETQGRVLEDGEAELEAMNVLNGVGFLVELRLKELQRQKLHRILTNWRLRVELRPIDERFLGDYREGDSLRISL